MGGLPCWLRGMVSAFYRYTGRSWLVNIIREARPRSASEYWRLVHRLETLALTFHQQYFERDQPTAILTPAHALPAPWHGTSLDLLPAASYAFLANLLGLPAGVAPWSQIQAGETVGLETGSRAMNQLFSHTLQESVGLPMSVQVMAPRWRDDIVLAIMRHLEMAQHSRGNAVER
jgi:fatty acid amide hydrolase